MWYAIVTEDTPNSLEKRLVHRPEHLARLTAMHEAGRLLLAGPFPAIDSADPGPALMALNECRRRCSCFGRGPGCCCFGLGP